jgi:hypothetical protein
VNHLRAFAGLLFAAKLLALAALHLRVGIALHLLEKRPGMAAINLSNEDVAVLLMCALFFLIAHMMEVGRRLVDENKEFI